jgi:hypothetical protein
VSQALVVSPASCWLCWRVPEVRGGRAERPGPGVLRRRRSRHHSAQQGRPRRVEALLRQSCLATTLTIKTARLGFWRGWIVDADLKDYFGSVDQDKLTTLIGKQIADGRVLGLIQQMLTAGYGEKGQKFPILSNIPRSRKTSNGWSYQPPDHSNFAALTRALRCRMSIPIVARFARE